MWRMALQFNRNIDHSHRQTKVESSLCLHPQHKISEMSSKLDAARLLTWRAAVARDKGEGYTKEAAMAKLFASEAATFCAHAVRFASYIRCKHRLRRSIAHCLCSRRSDRTVRAICVHSLISLRTYVISAESVGSGSVDRASGYRIGSVL